MCNLHTDISLCKCRNRGHDGDGDPKNDLIGFQNKGVATIVFVENYGKPKKARIRLIYENRIASPGVSYAWGRY